MAYQHRGGHGAHAAGHGGDGVHHRLCGGKLNIAAEFAFLEYMDAHVHDGLACSQAGMGDAIILLNFLAGLRGAGGIAQFGIRDHPGQRTVRDAVNVLFRAQSGADGAVIELLGQGTE